MLKRVLVSFDGKCRFKCKHCYTYDLPQTEIERTVDEIIDNLEDREFDIIYISQKNENFFEQDRGVLLCEKLYNRYKRDLFIITRNVLNNVNIARLCKLYNIMNKENHNLYVGVSICAYDSYTKTETEGIVPTPQERINFLKNLNKLGLKPILFLRPVFPDSIIPTQDYLKIIDECQGNISCVVTAGLMINHNIAERLEITYEELSFGIMGESEYLKDAIESEMKMVDVKKKMDLIEKVCKEKKVPLFKHSLHAVSFLKNDSDIII